MRRSEDSGREGESVATSRFLEPLTCKSNPSYTIALLTASLHKVGAPFASALYRPDQQGQTTATMKSHDGKRAGIRLALRANRTAARSSGASSLCGRRPGSSPMRLVRKLVQLDNLCLADRGHRTRNQTVMSGGIPIGFLDFAALSFEFDHVRRGLFTSFLVRNWCGQ